MLTIETIRVKLSLVIITDNQYLLTVRIGSREYTLFGVLHMLVRY